MFSLPRIGSCVVPVRYCRAFIKMKKRIGFQKSPIYILLHALFVYFEDTFEMYIHVKYKSFIVLDISYHCHEIQIT